MAVRLDLPSNGALLDTVARRTDWSSGLRACAVIFVSVLTAFAAQVSIPLPFTPVPFTLQPLVVLLGAVTLGSRLGMTSQLLYLAAGIAGLPVFAASPLLPHGIARLAGPTGGYLMSYPLAAFVTGLLAERGLGRRYLTSIVAMTAGLCIVFAGGLAWMAWGPVAFGIDRALGAGFYPFFALDLFKIVIGATVLPSAWKFLGRK